MPITTPQPKGGAVYAVSWRKIKGRGDTATRLYRLPHAAKAFARRLESHGLTPHVYRASISEWAPLVTHDALHSGNRPCRTCGAAIPGHWLLCQPCAESLTSADPAEQSQ